MALKALMLRKKLNGKTKELDALQAKAAELEQREAELETAIGEAETDEEHAAVEEAVDTFERVHRVGVLAVQCNVAVKSMTVLP